MNPLRYLATRFKAKRDPSAFFGAARETLGISRGSKTRPFDVAVAVRKFHGWTFVAASLNANACASTPLRMFVRKKSTGTKLFNRRPVSHIRKAYLMGDGRDRPSNAVLGKIAEFGDDWEEVAEPHNAIRLLSTANPLMNGYEFASLRMVYLQLTGNSYVHPVMNGPAFQGRATPGELWPMPPQNVWITPSNTPGEMVAGYKYGRTRESGTPFANDEVIHFKLPNPEDPFFYGMGRVKAVWTALGLSESKREVDTAKYDNYCRPDWLLGADGATKDALERIEGKINERLGGRHNAGKMIAVGGKVSGIALNLAEAVIGDPDRVIEEIAAGFGVPITMLLANDPNRANAEQGDASWMRNTILPYLRMDEEELNASYLPLWGIEGDACLAYDNPVPEDATARREDAKVALGGAPYQTVNEWREEQGLEPIDGGDVLMVPTTLMPAGSEAVNPLAGIVDAIGAAKPTGAPEATTGGGGPASVGASPDVQSTVLNGAQMAAMAGIVAQVAAGEVPRDAGVQMLAVGLQISSEQAERIMGTAGTAKPTTANPNPAAEAAAQAQADALAQNAGESQPRPGKGITDETVTRLAQDGRDAAKQIAAGADRHDLEGNGNAHVGLLPSVAGVGKVLPNVRKPLPVERTGAATSAVAGVVPGVEAGADNGQHRAAVKSYAAHETELAAVLRAVFAEQKTEAMGWCQGKNLPTHIDGKPVKWEQTVVRDGVSNGFVKWKGLGDLHPVPLETKDDDRTDKPKPPKPERLPAYLLDLTKWDKRLADAARPVVEKILRDAAKATAESLKVSDATWQVIDRNLPKAAERLSLKFAESTNATTSLKINDALAKLRHEVTEGVTEGDTPSAMTERVQKVFEEADESRAETIAKTETSRARHSAELETAKESGVVKLKKWLLSSDACPICEEIAADTGDGVPLDQPYATTDSKAYPTIDSPPAHPNCQCSQILVLNDEFAPKE